MVEQARESQGRTYTGSDGAMRLLIVGLLVLIATVALALSAQQDSGQVIISYGDWTIESSLVLFIAGLMKK